MAKKLSLVAFIYAKPGAEETLAARLTKLVELSRAEEGCVNYDVHRSDDDPTVFVMYENWKDRSDLDAHFMMSYMKDIVADLPDLLRAPIDMHYLTMISTPAKAG